MNKIFTMVMLSAMLSFAQSGWQPLNSTTTLNLNSVFFIDGNTGYAVGESGKVLKTTDAGATWTGKTMNPAVNLNAVYFTNLNTGIIAGNEGNIFRTTDAGANWNPVTSGVTDNLYSLSFSGTTGISGGSSQTILRTTNSGASWLIVQSGFFGGGFWGAHMVNSTTGYVAGQNSIFQPMIGKTTNSGANWEFVPFYINSNEGRLLDVHFFDASNGVTAAAVWDGTGGISTTSNGGTTWNSSIFGEAFSGLHFKGNIGYVVGLNGGIHGTSDGGVNWISQTSGTSNNLNEVFITSANTAFAVGDNGTILKTTTLVPVELTSFTVNISGSNAELKWETASEKNNYGFEIERSLEGSEFLTIGFVKGNGTSSGKNVYSFEDNLSSLTGQISYRLKQIDFNGQFEYSDVVDVIAGNIPQDFSVEQNYPNPFNPSTTIKYSLPFSGNVKISIYNSMGELISELFNGIQDAGIYNVDWNAENTASGIYFYSVQISRIDGSKNYSETRKMMLLK